MFTPAQKAVIAADILANQDLSVNPNTDPGNQTIAALYNANATPDFWVWKTSVSEDDIVGQPSVDGTQFSWTAFIGRSQGERDGWMRLFRSGKVNPSFTNVQQAIADIFSGAGAIPVAQRTHILTAFRRKATRLEKLLASGAGSTAAPATLTFEGSADIIGIADVRA
jgi:hypothetical protein